MTENTLALKIRLGNVQEWLRLAENPLHCAQLAVADTLKEVWRMNDMGGMITVTDLSQAVNRAVVWTAHAMKLAESLLAESKASIEVTAPPTPEPLDVYECDVCRTKFLSGAGVEPGDVCLACNDGTIDFVIPF